MRPLGVFQHFFRLVVLKNRPQDLEYSFALLLTFASVLVLQVAGMNFSLPGNIKANHWMVVMLVVLHECFFLYVLNYFLKKEKKENRFVQVASNFLGLDLIERLLLLPFIQGISNVFLLCCVQSWILLIRLHITRYAFEVSYGRAAIRLIAINVLAALPLMAMILLVKR